MKTLKFVSLLLAGLLGASRSAAQTLDWQSVEELVTNTRIWVKTEKQTYCNFQKATDDRLFCTFVPKPSAIDANHSDVVFNRTDVLEVRVAPQDAYDWSAGYLTFLLAAGAGGGWNSNPNPAIFAGIKVGGPATLDLQYDRVKGRNGFNTEGSAVLPLFRFPKFDPFADRTFVRVYAEPGMGYRAGGPFGEYGSAKMLFLLFTKKRKSDWSPYVEVQRRFPLNSPMGGDTRLAIGIMSTVCEHCGFD